MKNETFQLSLKMKWFEMTKSGKKTEDYREITSYWCNRFLFVDGEVKSKKWWQEKFDYSGHIFRDNIKWITDNVAIGNFTFKRSDINKMTLGYPKSTDTERIIEFEHKGIEIGFGKLEWGAEPNKMYFIVKHGKHIS